MSEEHTAAGVQRYLKALEKNGKFSKLLDRAEDLRHLPGHGIRPTDFENSPAAARLAAAG